MRYEGQAGNREALST